MSDHESISSNVAIQLQLHESVSSEGESSPPATQPTDALLAADFKGVASSGEIELVPGFNPANALHERAESELVELDGELSALPDAATTVYEQQETVCGSDDRVRISPATNLPWRWICKLFITFPDNAQFVGTGWFIGPRTVMTAGHCVYSKANGGWARSVEVVPGMDGASRPYGSQVGTLFRSVNGWINDAKPDFDYGAIILPDNSLGNRVGWFGFAYMPDDSLKNLFVNTSGYPADKPAGTQWFNAGTITEVTERRLSYMIDTIGGQSGSPVWRFLNGERHAVGVHAYGGCPNKATRIIKPVFDNMMEWRNLGF